ncbi:hypothetical protein DFH08DRAFT_1088637 [Mycena albidolilacea]|uniref:Uncharacterized protein n=1 Tax=Mycena albidolilacea TaxID=1033008 RepID=A0AAD6Z576_9AGAR|nr:hypothetical protein DFH08DRAFT_1088637 [Mycena albidolilacea]
MDALASTVACGSLGYAMDAARCTNRNRHAPLVRSAVQSSLATVRVQHKSATPSEPASSKSAPTSKPTPQSSKPSDNSKPVEATPPTHVDKRTSRPEEFARTSSATPRRLNDIARAPPELSSFGRKKSANPTSSSNHKTPVGKASVLSPRSCSRWLPRGRTR